MKRTGAKAVGLGFALFAAEARLLADDWQVVGGAAPAPKLLPVEIRPGEWSPAGSSAPPTVWLSAVKPVKREIPALPSADSGSRLTNAALPSADSGSRLNGASAFIPVVALPSIPPLPATIPQPPPVNHDWRPVSQAPRQTVQQEPAPAPFKTPMIVEDPPPAPPPRL